MTEQDQRDRARRTLEEGFRAKGIFSQIKDWEATITAYLRRDKRVTRQVEHDRNWKRRDRARRGGI